MKSTQIRLWKRFIDDCLGIWRGTKRSFENFVRKLNAETTKYGIKFPIQEVQFGEKVNFLDVTFYLGENNCIQYTSYTKPTDAKRYLRPQSFHPKNVFKAVPFSQMISTLERNSEEESKDTEMAKLIQDFVKSGYKKEELLQIKNKAIEHMNNDNNRNRNEVQTITFPVHYFEGLKDLKNY